MLPANRSILRRVIPVNSFRSFSIVGGSASNSGKSNVKKESIISNAPNWDEKDATESEADVKADRDPDDIASIEKKSANWFQQKDNK